jgi:hypothetical protein
LALSTPYHVCAQTINPSDGTDVTAWVNHYPSDTVFGTAGFFAVPKVNQTLQSLLDAKDIALIEKTYSVEDPIKEVDGYVVVNNCMPNECGSESSIVIVDAKTNDIVVGLFAGDAGSNYSNVTMRIFGTEDYLGLPNDVLSLLIGRQSN